MRLSDNSIASIAKLIQMAILTGTDITDNLRLIRFTQSGDFLEPDEEFVRGFEDGIKRMLETTNELADR
jgi:hypothetical protein